MLLGVRVGAWLSPTTMGRITAFTRSIAVSMIVVNLIVMGSNMNFVDQAVLSDAPAGSRGMAPVRWRARLTGMCSPFHAPVGHTNR
jgi:hypothetical protein